MIRLNLSISEQSARSLEVLADHNGVRPGTMGKSLLLGAITRELRRLRDAGDLPEYPQGELFTNSKGGKRGTHQR